MDEVKPKDYSRMGNNPEPYTTAKGEVLHLYPVSMMALCAAMGRHFKGQRANAILQLARQDNMITPDVLAKALAEIESRVFTMDNFQDEMKSMDGMRFIIWKSLLPEKKLLKLENVEDILSPDEWMIAENIILEISGVKTTGGEKPADPTKSTGPTLSTGST